MDAGLAPPAAAADGVMAVPMSVFPMTTALVGQHNLAGSPTSHLLMAPPAADAGVALTGGWVSLHLAPAAVTALAAATADVHTSLLLGPAADMLRNFSRVQMVEAGATAVLPGYLNLAGYVQTLLRFADLAGASAGLSSVAAAAVAGTHVQLLSAAVFVYRPVSAGAGAVAAVPGILTAKFSSTAAPAAAAAEAMVSVPKQQFLATLLGGRDLAGVTQWPAAQQHIMAPPAQSGAWPFLAGESVILSMTPAAMAATATAAACFRRAVLLGQPAAAGLTVLDWAGAVESGPSALVSGWFDLGRFVSALLEMHALGVSAAAATGRRAHLLLAAGSVTVLTGSETAATAAGAPAAAVVQGMVSAAVSTVTSSSAGALLPARSTAAARAARSAAAARAAHSAAAARAAGEPSGHSFNITYTYKAMGTESSLLPSHSGTEDDESNVWWSNPTFVPTEPFAGAGWVTRIELLEEEGSCGFKGAGGFGSYGPVTAPIDDALLDSKTVLRPQNKVQQKAQKQANKMAQKTARKQLLGGLGRLLKDAAQRANSRRSSHDSNGRSGSSSRCGSNDSNGGTGSSSSGNSSSRGAAMMKLAAVTAAVTTTAAAAATAVG